MIQEAIFYINLFFSLLTNYIPIMEILECICRQTDVLLNESPELVPRVILYLKVKVEI